MCKAFGSRTEPSRRNALRPACLQLGRSARVAACKQDHFMPQSHQLVRQPRNDALRPSVELGRNGFGQRSYLRDTHASLFASFQRPTFSTDPGGMAPCGHARLDLRGARWILQRRARSGSRFVFNQQAFGLEQHLQFDNGLHRTPLVPGVLEILLRI